MKTSSQIKAQGISILLTCTLGMCCLVTGCQSTPATEVIARKQDAMATAIAQESDGQSGASQALAVQPEVYESWHTG